MNDCCQVNNNLCFPECFLSLHKRFFWEKIPSNSNNFLTYYVHASKYRMVFYYY